MSFCSFLQQLRMVAVLSLAVTLAVPVVLGAENDSKSTIDLFENWPRQWVDERRSDAERRPAYQRVPPGLVPSPIVAQRNFASSSDIQLQSFESMQGDPQAVFAPVATILLPVGPPEAWWVQGEYLHWWVKGMKNTPPLVTTSSDQSQGGRIGESTTRALFPTATLFQSPGSGGRIRFGHWWNVEHSQGIEGDLWGLNGPHENFSVSSTGDPLIARPFFDTSPSTPGQNSEVVANADRQGGVTVVADSDLYAAGLSWRWNLGFFRPARARPCRSVPASFRFLPRGDIRLDFTCGYRYARLDEQLSVLENVTVTGLGRFDVQDHFRTVNDFNGAEIGLHYTHHHCRWSFDLRPRLAFGNVHQRTQITGSTLSTPTAGPSSNEAGGLLALEGTNIGTSTRDQFSFLPQLDAQLGYRITDQLAFTVGYSFLYWMRVARPGEQIDFNVNSEFLPDSNPFPTTPTGTGPRDPRPLYADTAFWAQGLNLGLEYRF